MECGGREGVRERGKKREKMSDAVVRGRGGNIYREQKREREREERQRNVVTDQGGRNISQHGP